MEKLNHVTFRAPYDLREPDCVSHRRHSVVLRDTAWAGGKAAPHVYAGLQEQRWVQSAAEL